MDLVKALGLSLGSCPFLARCMSVLETDDQIISCLDISMKGPSSYAQNTEPHAIECERTLFPRIVFP